MYKWITAAIAAATLGGIAGTAQAADGYAFCTSQTLKPLVVDLNDEDIIYLTRQKMPPSSRNSLPGAIKLTTAPNVAFYSEVFQTSETHERFLETRFRNIVLKDHPDASITTRCSLQPTKERAEIGRNTQLAKLHKAYGFDKTDTKPILFMVTTEPAKTVKLSWPADWQMLAPISEPGGKGLNKGNIKLFYRVAQVPDEKGRLRNTDTLEWKCVNRSSVPVQCYVPAPNASKGTSFKCKSLDKNVQVDKIVEHYTFYAQVRPDSESPPQTITVSGCESINYLASPLEVKVVN